MKIRDELTAEKEWEGLAVSEHGSLFIRNRIQRERRKNFKAVTKQDAQQKRIIGMTVCLQSPIAHWLSARMNWTQENNYRLNRPVGNDAACGVQRNQLLISKFVCFRQINSTFTKAHRHERNSTRLLSCLQRWNGK